MKNRIIEEFLNKEPLTEEEQKIWERDVAEMMAHDRWMQEMGYEYCTPTSPSLILLRENGFNPIGITTHYLEETFIFWTQKEANLAYKKMEKELGEIAGWWYSKRNWQKEYEKSISREEFYEKGHPIIHWLCTTEK